MLFQVGRLLDVAQVKHLVAFAKSNRVYKTAPKVQPAYSPLLFDLTDAINALLAPHKTDGDDAAQAAAEVTAGEKTPSATKQNTSSCTTALPMNKVLGLIWEGLNNAIQQHFVDIATDLAEDNCAHI